MEILIRNKFGFELIFKTDNVDVSEDIEDRIYSKTNFNKNGTALVERDIKTDVVQQFVSVLDDMIYYRKAEFDSSDLIKRLFEKLPKESRDKLMLDIKETYEDLTE